MANISDPVRELFEQPITPKTKPELSDLIRQRRADALMPISRPDTRLPYKTYDDTVDNFIYDPTDFPTVRELIKANVAKAIEDRFPVVGDKYTLTIENLNYEKPKSSSLSEEKEVLKSERSLQDRLRGTWVLRDTATGEELARKNATILNVPRMTSRGTFIRNGSEVGLKHMFRLKPGIYARIKGDGTPSVHINPAQTTGRQMSINMDQDTGIMTIARGTRTYGVLPMLIAAGVSEEDIERSWGKELLDVNKAKYGKLLANHEQLAEYRKLWDEGFSPIKLDPETTEATMGVPYDQMLPTTLLGAANKVVKLSRSMSSEDEDDRDSMAYQRIMGPADYIPERILRDGGGLLRKMFQRVIRDGNLDSIESGAFQPQVDSVFNEDKHAAYIDGASPFESLDNASSITRIGEGGIGGVEAAPAETRGVNDSYLGFVSPIRSPESLKTGLDVFMTYGVRKDSSGNLYARFTDKNGNSDYRPMGVVAKSIVTTPEFYDPNGDPEEFIPAFNRGKGLSYVQRKDVDYYLTSSNNMMSIGEGMIPNLGGIRSNRTLMGCLHPDTEIKIIRGNKLIDIKASELLTDHNDSDRVISLSFDNNAVCFRKIRGVHKISPKPCKKIVTMFGCEVIVSSDHRWVTMQNGSSNPVATTELLSKAVPKAPVWFPTFNDSVLALANNGKSDGTPNLWVWEYVTDIADYDYNGYLVDLDVDDNVYMLSNGLFTHNSKYNQQALPLRDREAPLVQRSITKADGTETTSEQVVAEHLGAKFSPVTGRVVSVTPDEIEIRDTDGVKHVVDLYNMYPANQKGFIHNTALVEPGQAVSSGQLLADSNYTKDGYAALGTNLKVAFMSGHGSENFEDAIAISESAAKKLASEQMYKFRGDLTDDTTYGKEKYLSLFGSGDYTDSQLDNIDENGLPKIGAELKKGDPVFLGVQIRDLSTSGLSRNAAVPYVKTWEHDEPGTVEDVVKGRKHLTIYTRAFTPMQIGDKMCYDDQTEVMTKRGWVLFKDLLAEDQIFTLDIRAMTTRFSEYEAAFKYYCNKEPLYRLTSKRLDIATTADHRHVVAAMNNPRYVDFQTSKDIFGKGRWFITGSTGFDKGYCYAYSRDGDAKERWEKYTGFVYCITVPETHTMYVRRNGKTMWSANSGRFGDKSIVSCYPSTYNIMCEDGIKPIKDLTTNDKVAVFDPKTETANFEHPIAVQHYDYNGDLFGYEDKHLEWLVTPNHGMWCRDGHDNHKRHPENALYRRKEASAIYGEQQVHRIAASFPQSCGNKQTFRLPDFVEYRSNAKNTIDTFSIDDFSCFLGIWIAEGHLLYNEDGEAVRKGCGKHYVVITQKEDVRDPESSVRCRKIEALLNRMGLSYSRNGIKYTISHKGLCAYLKRFGHAKDKYIPQEVFTDWPRSAQQNLFDWYYMGDGDKAWAAHDLRASTCSLRLRDDLCRLGTVLGYSVKWVCQRTPNIDKRGTKQDYLWRISFSRRSEARSKNQSDRKIRRGYYVEHYEGQVHCCTVSTGVILVAKEGKFMWCGNSIIPDDQMVRDGNGVPYDAIKSPLSLPSRLNTAMLSEVQLSKVAKLLGRPITVPDFITDDTINGYTKKLLDKYGLKETTTVYDPRSGKYIDDVSDGYLFHFKLKHMAELKERSRGTGTYSSEDVPLKGEGAARRLGMMETSAVYSGGGMDVLRDAKLIRGQRNDEFWKAYRDGQTPDVPGTPLVHKKFFAHLLASGANIEPQPDGSFKLGAATDKDIYNLTGNRQVTQAATFDSKNMHPIQGGLFDPNIFGDEGDQWGYYELPEPVLNPLMFKPIANIMGWTDTELREYLQGQRKIDDKFGPEALIDKIKGLDLEQEVRRAKDLLKSKGGTLQQRDLARKRIRAIEPLLQQGIKPEDLFFTRLPILPPRFRTVTVIQGGDTNIAADANFLYKKAIDAANDLKEALEKLPGEFQTDARESLYNAVNALVGTMPTDDPKLEAKGVGGLLKWAFGKGSPKLSSVMRKVFGSNLDLGGLGTIIPDNKLKLDQVGIPLESAWKMYEPFVVRDLRQNGYSMVQAMKEVLEKSPDAEKSLRSVMSKRPLLLNRAPTLWRYGIQGLYPVPVEGNAIRVNPAIDKVYGADHDGDTVLTTTRIEISTKILNTAVDKSENCDIFNTVTEPITMEESMLQQETKVKLVNVNCAICDVPKLEATAKEIKENITEWDVPEGVFAESLDRTTGKLVKAPVTKISQHRNIDMYDVAMETYGAFKHIVTMSGNDTLLTYDKGEIKITDVTKLESKVVPRARNFEAEMSPEICTKYIDIGKQVPLTLETGIFFGIMLGDVWVDSNNVARIAAECPEIQQKVIEITDPTNTYLPVQKASQLWEYDTVRMGSDKQHRLTVYLGTSNAAKLKEKIGTGAYNKRIPLECMAASKAHRLGILIGLIATDGGVNYTKAAKGKKTASKSVLFHTTSQLLRDGIQALCQSLGIRSNVNAYYGPNSLVECYAVSLSLTDLANLYNSDKRFRMIADRDEENLRKIASEVTGEDKIDSYDIVPFPGHLSILIGQAGDDILSPSERNRYKVAGYWSRTIAKRFVERLKSFDYATYTEMNRGKKSERPGYTPEQVKKLAEEWITLVENERLGWEVVTSVHALGKMDGWDLTVEGPYTFALSSGTFVQDSMTTHVPVSQTAIDAINKNMLPSKNLLSPKNFKAHYIPRDAANEGLFLASRIRPGEPVRFKTQAEAEAAYKRGEIKVDTPIIIG